MKRFLLLFICLANCGCLLCQKPLIDTAVLDSWPSVRSPMISNDGKYALYWIINEPAASQTLIVSSTDGKWQIRFPRAIKGSSFFTQDSRKVLVKVPGDSLGIFDLGKANFQYLIHIESFKVNRDGNYDWLACELIGPERVCVVHNLQTGSSYSEQGVLDYVFDTGGNDLIMLKSKDNNNFARNLIWLTLFDGGEKVIWSGRNCYEFVFDGIGNKMAFVAEEMVRDSLRYFIWLYKIGSQRAELAVSGVSQGIQTGFILSNSRPSFSKDNEKLFFQVIENSGYQHKNLVFGGVTVWNYKDKCLQPLQSKNGPLNSTEECSIDLRSYKITILNALDESIVYSPYRDNNEYVLVYKSPFPDAYFDNNDRPSFFLESIRDGKRILLTEHFNFNGGLIPNLSPDEKYVVWYNMDSLAYFLYDIDRKSQRNLSQLCSGELYDKEAARIGYNKPYGIAGWLQNDEALLIYDQYDIWRINLKGEMKVFNATKYLGNREHIVFGIVNGDGYTMKKAISIRGGLLMDGFNNESKENGYWILNLDSKNEPERTIMDAHSYWVERIGEVGHMGYASAGRPIKSLNAGIYLVTKMSSSESPNLFITRDFANYYALSNVYPERKYNWLNTELIKWKMLDGHISQGILYKPENFDSSKKYPIIFEYYEKRSDELNKYIAPDFCHDRINISYFVSNGYLVFVPDIYYCPGKNGKGVINSVLSAAKYFSQFSWVDSLRLGLQGHSFGGWETNYLITHSMIFAAACEAAGVCDEISSYGQLENGTNDERQRLYEIDGQGSPFGLGNTPWSEAREYIDNSPVFGIGSITTPLLMMHCRRDASVPFEQAIELFTGMRRAGKRVWLLEYENGAHSLFGNDARDYTVRLKQFFDHYLKGTPAPIWMTVGIPANEKGFKSGLDYDRSGMEP